MLSLRFERMGRLRCMAILTVLGVWPLRARAAMPGGPAAAVILRRAEARAQAEHKNIMLEFGASWCVNCKLYDRMLADPSLHAILHKAFVFTEMDTGENPTDRLHANTPGGVAFEDALGGKDAGWPFLVILNAKGRPIISSFRPDAKAKSGQTNIGYPVLPVEVNWFMTMVRRGAPSLSRAERAKVRAWLTAVAAKILRG